MAFSRSQFAAFGDPGLERPQLCHLACHLLGALLELGRVRVDGGRESGHGRQIHLGCEKSQ
jgi:hypothetical protein